MSLTKIAISALVATGSAMATSASTTAASSSSGISSSKNVEIFTEHGEMMPHHTYTMTHGERDVAGIPLRIEDNSHMTISHGKPVVTSTPSLDECGGDEQCEGALKRRTSHAHTRPTTTVANEQREQRYTRTRSRKHRTTIHATKGLHWSDVDPDKIFTTGRPYTPSPRDVPTAPASADVVTVTETSFLTVVIPDSTTTVSATSTATATPAASQVSEDQVAWWKTILTHVKNTKGDTTTSLFPREDEPERCSHEWKENWKKNFTGAGGWFEANYQVERMCDAEEYQWRMDEMCPEHRHDRLGDFGCPMNPGDGPDWLGTHIWGPKEDKDGDE